MVTQKVYCHLARPALFVFRIPLCDFAVKLTRTQSSFETVAIAGLRVVG
jgi:hypothetical protein